MVGGLNWKEKKIQQKNKKNQENKDQIRKNKNHKTGLNDMIENNPNFDKKVKEKKGKKLEIKKRMTKLKNIIYDIRPKDKNEKEKGFV